MLEVAEIFRLHGESFRAQHDLAPWQLALEEAIARDMVKREPIWTESLTIGSASFVERIQPLLLTRRQTEVIEMAEGLAVLQESPLPYGQKKAAQKWR